MSRVTRVGTARVCLGAIGLFMLPAGVQAAFAPRSFFENFPVGRGWIAAEGGSYDEHLVRDVGVLFLALVIVTLWSALGGLARRVPGAGRGRVAGKVSGISPTTSITSTGWPASTASGSWCRWC